MDVGSLLHEARRRAGLTQRKLAARSGVAQPTIARIEKNQVDPRWSTLVRLLGECGVKLSPTRPLGQGVDRTQIRQMLELDPLERLELLRGDASGLRRLDEAKRV